MRVFLQHEIARRVGIFHTNTSSPSYIPICNINGEIPEGPQMRVFGCLSAFSSLCAISRAPFGTGRNYPSWKNSPRARSRWFSYGLGGLENGNNAHPSIHPRVGVNQKTKRGEENYERRRRRRLLSITPARTGEERQYLFHLSFSSPSLGPAINDSIKIVYFFIPLCPFVRIPCILSVLFVLGFGNFSTPLQSGRHTLQLPCRRRCR